MPENDAGGAGGQQQQQNGQQQQTPPWFQGIDAETLGHWDNKGLKYKEDPKALATELTKAWKSLESHFGVPADRLLKLPKDATDEAGWKAVRARLGVPAEPKEYDFSAIKGADGKDVDGALADTMRAALHKAGVAKDAAPEVVKAVVGHLGGKDAAEATERLTKVQAERATLKKDWGPDNYDFNRLTAIQGAKRLGVDEATVASLEGVIGYAKIMEMFRKIGAGTNEDSFKDAGGSPVTRNGAVARRAALEADTDFMKRYLSGGVKEVAEMNNLIAQIVGEAA